MASRLRRSESGVAGVQRMLRRETKRVVRVMGSGHAPRGEAIHDARKRLKKARAALRLARARFLRTSTDGRTTPFGMPRDRSARSATPKLSSTRSMILPAVERQHSGGPFE